MENIKQVEFHNNYIEKNLELEAFCNTIEKSKEYIKLGEDATGDFFMGKYKINTDKSICLVGITPNHIVQTELLYEISREYKEDFYVYRSFKEHSVTSNIIKNYLPFSTSITMEYALNWADGKRDVILRILIKKYNKYIMVGGEESEILMQPGIIIINSYFDYEYKNDYDEDNTIRVYNCVFCPYTKNEAIELINENKCESEKYKLKYKKYKKKYLAISKNLKNI